MHAKRSIENFVRVQTVIKTVHFMYTDRSHLRK